MTDFGYTLSSEEFGPNELVGFAREAESRGYDFLSASDHFHPWLASQGESPFVWSTLGAVAEATDDVDLGVGVTCPTVRIHPVNVSQAAATTKEMLGDREFYFGVGTGEALNEHVTGERWPEHEVRLAMLEEAVDVIRSLWTGRQVSHHGDHYTVENARLFTLPDELPPIVVSAFGERTARAAGEFGDGFWSVGPQDTVSEFDGDGPKLTQLSVCVAETEAEAVETAHENWRQSALPGELAQELPTPKHFDQASELVTKERIREGSILTSTDPQDHVDSIQQCLDAGYDHVYFHQIGDDQSAFFDFYEEEVFPSFR
ncbi:TIGR03557 family F420-dependent LLM class oxidoreductase [Halogeometricum limi]|uniref:F420-dependent oxidoreductase, G6PDH family n=1 Tax=Halogeometricum limi TaxID=555875 RepID=A0A1I6I5G2_9EURY|nr:TIGR03557 family F420-dependent LLM class oxidoreductase [Halogeometricum limi]SFR61941.1 F420-dependent oxidoreductase, G6PDH family [Halogeometricum limi]